MPTLRSTSSKCINSLPRQAIPRSSNSKVTHTGLEHRKLEDMPHTSKEAWRKWKEANGAKHNSSSASTSYVPYKIYESVACRADRHQGTTFSGVAFAFATNTEAKEDIIVEWPGAGTQTKQKVRNADAKLCSRI